MATQNSVNNKLGPNGSLTINSLGAINLPQQPCFCFYLSSNQIQATGSGTLYVVPFNTQMILQGCSFVDGIFTAQTSGNYLFNWSISLDSSTVTSSTSAIVVINTSAGAFFSYSANLIPNAGIANSITFSGSTVCPMAFDDTAKIELTVYGQVSDSITVMGNSGPIITYFSGAMLS